MSSPNDDQRPASSNDDQKPASSTDGAKSGSLVPWDRCIECVQDSRMCWECLVRVFPKYHGWGAPSDIRFAKPDDLRPEDRPKLDGPPTSLAPKWGVAQSMEDWDHIYECLLCGRNIDGPPEEKLPPAPPGGRRCSDEDCEGIVVDKGSNNVVLSGRKGDIEEDSPDEDPDDFNEEDEANNLLKCCHCGEPIPLEGQQCAHCHCAHCTHRVSEVAFSIDRS